MPGPICSLSRMLKSGQKQRKMVSAQPRPSREQGKDLVVLALQVKMSAPETTDQDSINIPLDVSLRVRKRNPQKD